MATPSDKEYGRRPGEINDRKDLCESLPHSSRQTQPNMTPMPRRSPLCNLSAQEERQKSVLKANKEAFEQQIDGIIPDAAWGTFAAYLANFITSFKDPNDSRTAQNELAVLYPRKGQSMKEFFQIFDQLAQRAGHGTNDKLCIELLEAKVPSSLIEQVYKDEPPTVYDQYKASVI